MTTTSDTVVEVDGVYKKFRRGELFDSLRDLVPALVKGVGKRRAPGELDQREFWAVSDVSFSVRRGEAFGIIGGNGAGKSTILKMLAGIMRPTKGSVRVRGRLSALIEVSAGFHPDFTGRENIFLNGAILGMTRDEIRSRFDAIVDFSGLERFIDTPVKRYSSGMYARLGFSVAAHVDPEVLIVDEVLSVGDYIFQQKCIDRMNAVITNGATVLFVSHNLQAVASLCPRSVLLEKGNVRMIGATDEVIRTYYSRAQQPRVLPPDWGLAITSVTTHDASGQRGTFESGAKISVTVVVEAQRLHEEVAIVLQIVDENQYAIFDTCTYRLGAGYLTVDAGQTLTATFELNLYLAHGTFHVNAYAHRYTTDIAYDKWMTAASIIVTGAPDVRGLVTLHPSLTECTIARRVTPSEASLSSAQRDNAQRPSR